jgi:hypothetical protein
MQIKDLVQTEKLLIVQALNLDIPSDFSNLFSVNLGSIQFAPKKKARLAFQAELPILVRFKNRFGCCAKRAVIEENDIWI